jgi:hypothetical protein
LGTPGSSDLAPHSLSNFKPELVDILKY